MTPDLPDATDTTAAIDAARAAVDRGVGWLLEQVDDGGVPRCGAEGTYRLPHTLLLTGHRDAAAATLSWMQREILTTDGDLRPGPMRTAFGRLWSSYPLAIIAEAAWKLDRYDIATDVLRTLQSFQDPETGGAYAARPELRDSARQDLFPTAQLGITALVAGRMEMADQAARWLQNLWHAQPELPQRLYTATDGPALIVDTGDDPRHRFGLVTDLQHRRQAYYNPGIAAAFLARYASATGDRSVATVAADYLALSVNGTAAQFDHAESVQICKFGWGAAALLDLTGEAVHAEQVVRMIDWFCAAQRPDGRWDNSPFLTPDGPTVTSAFEVTTEFVQHLVVMGTALAGHRV